MQDPTAIDPGGARVDAYPQLRAALGGVYGETLSAVGGVGRVADGPTFGDYSLSEPNVSPDVITIQCKLPIKHFDASALGFDGTPQERKLPSGTPVVVAKKSGASHKKEPLYEIHLFEAYPKDVAATSSTSSTSPPTPTTPGTPPIGFGAGLSALVPPSTPVATIIPGTPAHFTNDPDCLAARPDPSSPTEYDSSFITVTVGEATFKRGKPVFIAVAVQNVAGVNVRGRVHEFKDAQIGDKIFLGCFSKPASGTANQHNTKMDAVRYMYTKMTLFRRDDPDLKDLEFYRVLTMVSPPIGNVVLCDLGRTMVRKNITPP